ncbi:hypothetical protein KAOT1_08599 [Kordia algicida OT-1]|uniref:Uncharacterized protein n=1 Tax=Kordia algicida OT-1 TaxID=391587 RepID=A9E6Y8_9FLAO|nr:hypothetical protein [Kordia algicida]EDP94859.1 hypothetical protein KAOT1_08599 [Kordia algicida OT-1]
MKKIALIPVLEIEPYDFSKKEYQFPLKTFAKAPLEWYEFWVKSISDSN